MLPFLLSAFMLPFVLSALVLPVLVPVLLSAFILPLLLSRPSAFMSLAPLALSLSELMLFDFWPGIVLSSVRWLLAAPGDFSSDWVAFMHDSVASRPVGAAEPPLRSDDRALC